ncbi:MAG: electron transfer flavoprotein beta subunit/FixA family protein, partial [Muribaculaceae bacterium]|nr:electron transfer flavoprotein beta subunit/FixA family protein [Muribaculaceae bacterium]
NAKCLQKFKYAAVPSEVAADEQKKAFIEARPYLSIGEWNANTVEADLAQCGLAGSPTKVKGIENVVFSAKDARKVENSDSELEALIVELIASHTIG